jgi:ABC-2 type transport system ATP-binding protein
MPFDLEQYKNTRASKLSGGFKKRLNVACTLVAAPEIWLFDEPCANLDEKWRSEMAEMVVSLKKRGCTVIYVSHDPAEYESFADQVLFMNQ